MIIFFYNISVLISISYLAYQKISKKATIELSMIDFYIVILLTLLRANEKNINPAAYIMTALYGITIIICVTKYKRKTKIIYDYHFYSASQKSRQTDR